MEFPKGKDLNISLIICTKDRPVDLKILLDSIQAQDEKPFQLIIVDGSDNPVEDVVDSFGEQLKIEYYPLRPPGLTRQRNFGISKLKPETDWVGFLDDDLELCRGCLSDLRNFIQSHSSLGGVGLKIKNQPNPKKSFLRELFLIDNFPGGVVTLSGAAAPIRPYDESLEVEWLYGGATFWKKEVLDNYSFDEWYSGVGYCEDLDFSYRVSRNYKLMISANSECFHHDKEIRLEKMKPMGEWSVVAWWYFARIKNDFNPIFILWSIFSISLANLFSSILKGNRGRWNYFLGTVGGVFKILLGKVQNSKGFQK